MREIKFRAWDNENKSMNYDVDLNVCKYNGDKIMQYTGLKDRNGKEIYEGDVVFNSNKTLLTLPDDKRIYLVKWQNGEFGETDNRFWLKKTPSFIFEKINPVDKKYMSLIFSQQQIEVIGNIYENPELLK